MRRRRLARAAVGTAVVAGTAGAVHHYQDKRYADQDAADQEQYQDAYDQEQYQDAYDQGAADAQAQQAPAPAPAPEEDMTGRLQDLASLHDSGALTDEEFAAAKQKLLGT
jgi:hypothetical protein